MGFVFCDPFSGRRGCFGGSVSGSVLIGVSSNRKPPEFVMSLWYYTRSHSCTLARLLIKKTRISPGLFPSEVFICQTLWVTVAVISIVIGVIVVCIIVFRSFGFGCLPELVAIMIGGNGRGINIGI